MRMKVFWVIVILTMTGAVNLSFHAQEQKDTGTTEEWTAPSWADTLQNPVKGEKSSVEAGAKIFSNTCTVCHGQQGQGDGPAAKGLQPQPKNLASKKVQQQSDGALFWKLTTGNPPMASYEKVYSEKELWQLVSFIRSLADTSE